MKKWVSSRVSNKFYKLWLYIDAGVPIDKALLSAGFEGVARRVRSGMSISDSFRAEGFPDFVVNLIKIAEQAGIGLSDMVNQIHSFLQRMEDVERKILYASLFPSFLLAVALLVIWAYIVFVIPELSALLEDFGVVRSPIYVLDGLSELLKENFLLFNLSLLFALSPLALPYFLRGRGAFPEANVSLFFRMLAILAKYRIDTVTAIGVALPLLREGKMKREFVRMLRFLQEGKVPEINVGEFSELLSTAFETGKTFEVFTALSQEFEDRFERKVNLFTKLIEPAVGAVIGAFVILVFLMVYLPVMRAITEKL